MEERFYELRKSMKETFAKSDFLTAKLLAEEYLSLAEQLKNNWNYGNAIHHANLVLGHIALKKGDVEGAKTFLLTAGNTPGSPQLQSFGPNMALAEELLKEGETATVLEYLKQSTKYWWLPFRFFKLRRWRKQVKAGQVPEFGAHLLY